MNEIASNQAEQNIPLTYKDQAVLDEMFEKLKVEEICQIEASPNPHAVMPIEAWDEKGWVANSFLPNRQ
jgi:hypothetical protein